MPSSAHSQPGTRERMLAEATRIFADKGFDKASTREICQAAGVNIGSISYYFGDKQGLYREALVQPVLDLLARVPAHDAELPLQDWLRGFYQALLAPLRSADGSAAQLMRLLGREMLEPSMACEALFAQHIGPQHAALIEVLRQRVGAAEADLGLQHLAHALTALVQDYWMSADYMEALAPGVVYGPGAYERVLARMVAYGAAMVEQERLLRLSPPHLSTHGKS